MAEAAMALCGHCHCCGDVPLSPQIKKKIRETKTNLPQVAMEFCVFMRT